MKRSEQRAFSELQAEHLLDVLSMEQFVHPHQPTAHAALKLVQAAGVCHVAIARALDSLKLDKSKPIGRLRRTELAQLARVAHRFWRQNVVAQTRPAQSV